MVSEESLWPARMIAEFAYCPRLFFLMHVEGVFIPSEDTEEGVTVHRRVDKPNAAPAEGGEEDIDPERPKVVRKLAISSEALGLTAVLDLAEINGKRAVPVEYRKGRPKCAFSEVSLEDKEEADGIGKHCYEPWPADRVQIGLQCLLLEEYGYEVCEAVIYYAEIKRRLKIDVDESIKAEARRTLEEAKRCAEGPRPLPLLNDPRCPRCSLQPACLPDEVNYQIASAEGSAVVSPRKIWPPRDDGIHVIAQQDGVKLGLSGSELRVTGKDGSRVRSIPIVNVESVALLGNVQITTQAIGALAERNIPIAFLSSAGRLKTIIDPMDSVSADIRRAQVLVFEDPAKRLELARSVISAKIANQRVMLMRNHGSLPENISKTLAEEIKMVESSSSVDEVRGHEGLAASLYFKCFQELLKGHLALEFGRNGRKRRPPPDPVNACLSMAYSMLTNECVAALRIAGLEPVIGGYHVSRPGRPALALDLMEPFRPLVADSIALTCFNKGELTEGHFIRTTAGCNFTSAGRRNFFEAYHRRMSTEVSHPVFKYKLSYRRMITLHARMLVAWLLGEIPDLAFLTTR